MLVLVGQGARLQRYLVGLPKAYRVRARFGATSTTGDPTGELSVTGARTGEDSVRQALEPLRGEIRQRVPAYLGGEGGGGTAVQRPAPVRRWSFPSGPCGSTGWT